MFLRLSTVLAIVFVVVVVVVLWHRTRSETGATDITIEAQSKVPRFGTPSIGSRSARIGPVLGAPVSSDYPDPTQMMVVPDAFRSSLPPGIPTPDYGVTPGVYPGSVSLDDLYNKFFGLVQWASENIFPQYNERALNCRDDFHARGGVVVGTTKWDVALRIVGDGTRIRVVDVLVDPSFWPPSFDDELKACLVDALVHSSAPSVDRVDMTVDATLCFAAR